MMLVMMMGTMVVMTNSSGRLVPPELLEPSQPTVEPEQTTAKLTPNPGESPGERGCERGSYNSPIHHTKLVIYSGILVIGQQ